MQPLTTEAYINIQFREGGFANGENMRFVYIIAEDIKVKIQRSQTRTKL